MVLLMQCVITFCYIVKCTNGLYIKKECTKLIQKSK